MPAYVVEMVTKALNARHRSVTDHPEFDYAEAAARAPLLVDARNATWGMTVPEGRVVRL